MLRHTVATLAYRGGKALRGAPAGFEGFRPAEGSRSAGEILAHVGDLLDWALSLANGAEKWHNSPAIEWGAGTARFFAALKALDDRLASSEPPGRPAEMIFQGPIADSLTHIGQISMLRLMAGAPVKGENYSRARIAAGTVGAEQAEPRAEFD
jgi:hypothetical protein